MLKRFLQPQRIAPLATVAAAFFFFPSAARASEGDLILPDLRSQTFLGLNGHTLLALGLVVALAGIGLRAGDLQSTEKAPRSSIDARSL